MTGRLAIGDFARSTHLSVKALRHYHDVGLLVPAEIDPQSGYRYYDPDQVPLAQVIRRLRDLGMPLDGVKDVMDAPDLDRRNAAIAAHLTRMEQQLSETRQTVAELRDLLQAPPARLPVTMRTVEAADVVAIAERVRTEDFLEWWTDAFGALFARLRECGVEPAGVPGALYSGELFEVDEGEITAFVPVGGAVADVADTARITSIRVPQVEAAAVVHAGSLGELDLAYGALGVDLAEHGAITLPGPIREYYLISPFETDDESRHRTEICWPVFRTAA